jgi:hypothetical protein
MVIRIIENVRDLTQDIVALDIKAQLTALESKVDRNHAEVMTAINRIVDYKDVIARLVRLEERQQPNQ